MMAKCNNTNTDGQVQTTQILLQNPFMNRFCSASSSPAAASQAAFVFQFPCIALNTLLKNSTEKLY